MNIWKIYRLSVSLSQREVANALGYSTPQFISNWERGISNPPISIVKELAKLYKITPEEIIKKLEEIEIYQLRIKYKKLLKK